MPLNAMPFTHTKDEKSILPFFPSTEVFPEDFFDLSQTDINCASLAEMHLPCTKRRDRVRARACSIRSPSWKALMECGPHIPWGTVDRWYNSAETLAKQACALLPGMVEWRYSLQNIQRRFREFPSAMCPTVKRHLV